MNSDRSPGIRKRGRGLAIFGAMVADGSIILWLLGGPWQWLFGAGFGCLLVALGIAKRNRDLAPSQSSSP